MEGISTAKTVRFGKSTTKVHIRENRIIVLPVNILTGVAHRLLGPHDTLPCVLINPLCLNLIVMLRKMLTYNDCKNMQPCAWDCDMTSKNPTGCAARCMVLSDYSCVTDVLNLYK